MALEWSVDLGTDEPRKRSIVASVALAVGAIGTMFLSPWLGVTGLVLVLLSNSEVFLKQHFRIDENGVRRRCGASVSAMEWAGIKSIREDDGGVKCSPFSQPMRSDPFRGVYLKFAEGNRNAVLATIHEHFHGDSGILGRGTDSGGGAEAERENRA